MVDRWYAKLEKMRPSKMLLSSLYSKRMPKPADRWKMNLARRNLLAKW
jgi:hypothetical protein